MRHQCMSAMFSGKNTKSISRRSHRIHLCPSDDLRDFICVYKSASNEYTFGRPGNSCDLHSINPRYVSITWNVKNNMIT